MDGILQSKIKPHTAPSSFDFNSTEVKSLNPKAQDSTANGTSFKDLILNSNDEVIRQRAAQQNGDGIRAARTDEEFAKMMADKLNRENLRKPQNELDKDAFLKLFVTQMQNQDPLNPDNSAEMAAQLAQFHGLEQMMNVNKNLEKMQNEQNVTRAVGLIDFVGKEIKLDNGKINLADGKVSDAVITVTQDAPKAMLEIRDAAGAVIATRDMGFLRQGDHAVNWDGLDNNGKKAASGVYTVAIVAKDLNDQDLPVKITSMVKVTGVDLKDAGGSFYTDMGKIRINEVSSVGEAGVFGKKPNETQTSGKSDTASNGPTQNADARAPKSEQPRMSDMNTNEDAPFANTAAPASPPTGVKAASSDKPLPQEPPMVGDPNLSRPPSALGTAMEFPIQQDPDRRT